MCARTLRYTQYYHLPTVEREHQVTVTCVSSTFFLTTFRERIIQIPRDTSRFTSNHPRQPAHLSRLFSFSVFPCFLLAAGTRSSFLSERGQPRLDCVFTPLVQTRGGQRMVRTDLDTLIAMTPLFSSSWSSHAS